VGGVSGRQGMLLITLLKQGQHAFRLQTLRVSIVGKGSVVVSNALTGAGGDGHYRGVVSIDSMLLARCMHAFR
jgi:hypothetical protein